MGDEPTAGTTTVPHRIARWMYPHRFPLLAFAIWRLVHLLLVAAFGGLSGERPAGHALEPASHPGFFVWDAAWYQRILEHGYEETAQGSHPGTAFFPLVPWLTWLVRLATRDELIAAVVVSTVAAALATLAVHATVRALKDESTARWAVVLLLCFPTSMFLWLLYSEAVFIAASAAAVLAHHRGRPAWAAACVAAAAMSRPPGAALAGVLCLDALRSRLSPRRMTWYVGGAAAGLMPVLAAQWLQAGDPLAWTTATEHFGRSLTLPWTTIATAARWFRPGEGGEIAGWSLAMTRGAGSLLDFAALVLFLWLGMVAWLRRWPAVLVALVVVYTAIPLFSGLLTSMSRYVLAAWPGFAVLAGVLSPTGRVVAAAALAGVSLLTLHDLAAGLFIA